MNKSSLLFFIFFVGFFFTVNGFSDPPENTPDISGFVTDLNGIKIELTAIFIPGLKIGTYTDSSGYYALNHVPSGQFTLEFVYPGYHTLVKTIDHVKGDPITLNVSLVGSPLETNNIVITAPYATLPEETPYSFASLTHNEIQFSGATTLTEALTHIPGINQVSTGDGIAKPVIRGLHGNRISTVIEGFRFDNQQWQDEHGLGLSGMGINAVEILKGPASLLYGADAMGGVLNLVDEKTAPVGQTISDYNVKIDQNTLGINTDIGIKKSTDSFYWMARLGGDTHADYLDGNNERVANTRFNGLSFKSNFGYIGKKHVSNINYYFSLYQFGLVENEEGKKKEKEDERFGREMEEAYHSVKYHLLTTQNTLFVGASQLKIDVGLHLNNRQEHEGQEDVLFGDLDMQLNTISANARFISPISVNSKLALGLQGVTQSNINNGSRILIPDAHTTEISAYAYFRHELDDLIIEEGIRFNKFHLESEKNGIQDSAGFMPALDNSYTPVSGSLGLSYKVTNSLLTKVNFSIGFRAPGLAELSSNGLHEGTLNYEIGDPDLKSEENSEIDLGIQYNSSLLSIDASLFRNKFNHYIFLSPTDELRNGNRVFRFLQSNSVLKGGELSLTWTPENTSGLIIRNSFSFLEGKQNDGSYLPLMPANKMINELKINTNIWNLFHNGFLKMTVITAFEQKLLADAELKTPGYTLVNLEVGGSVLGPGIYGTLTISNLLAKKYYDHLSLIKPGRFTDPDVGFNNMGRNFTVALHIPLSGQN